MKKHLEVVVNEYEELLNCLCLCEPWEMSYLVFRVSAYKVKHFAYLRTFVGKTDLPPRSRT